MKIVPENSPQDNNTISAEQRQVRTETLVAQMKIHPGHTVYEFDLVTGQIEPAKIDSVSATYGGGTNKRINQRPYCLYCSALNKKNAIKKLVPMYAKLVEGGHIIREQSIEPQTDKN